MAAMKALQELPSRNKSSTIEKHKSDLQSSETKDQFHLCLQSFRILPKLVQSARVITRVVRHRVLKWTRFVRHIIFWGVNFWSLSDWLAHCQYVINIIWPRRSKAVEQITLDLFRNCDVPEEVSGTFDPEVDLNDDAVGRSRYERFYSVHSPIMQQKI